MDVQGQVPFDEQGLVTQILASAQVNAAEGWVHGLDHTLIRNALTTYQDDVRAYITAQNPDATVGEVLGTKKAVPMRRPVLAAGLPYQLVVRGQTYASLPEMLRHQFRFTLYATILDQLSEIPVLSFTQSLPRLAGKKLTLSFAPASQADANLIASYLPQLPADGSPLDPGAFPTSLPGYLIHLVAELRIDGVVVARGGSLTMGQVLVSTAGLYDPQRGWQDVENTPPVAGEYRALAINAAGIAASQIQALYDRLAMTRRQLEAGQLAGLTGDDITGDVLYSAVLSYFAANDAAGQLSARTAGVVEYRRPSFGSFTAKVQSHLLFGIPRTGTFPGLELDITRLDSMVVSKTNDPAIQVAYVRQNGFRQSALEHSIPPQLFATAQHPREAVSAVKALAVASRQGQRLYTITPDTVANALPQLTIDPDVTAEIQAALATRKQAIVSQHEVTVGGWTGVGYIIVDPETGAGAYQISGGGEWLRSLVNGNCPAGVCVDFVLGRSSRYPCCDRSRTSHYHRGRRRPTAYRCSHGTFLVRRGALSRRDS